MNLYKKTYVKNWTHTAPEERTNITVKRGGKILKSIKPERITYIVEEVAYWRKANQIHKWFVDNVQDGEDDCKEYYVSHEQLKQLLEIVNIVLASSKMKKAKIQNGTRYEQGKVTKIMVNGSIMENTAVAESLLPTEEGFFFGGTEYNNYYIEDLKQTKKMLEEVLTEDSDSSFYYSSSW